MPRRILVLLPIILIIFMLACQNSKPQIADIISIETPKGTMQFALLDSTPQHKANFLRWINANQYDSLLIHKADGQVIQGGDPSSKTATKGKLIGFGDNGETIPAEIRYIHLRGSIAAARASNVTNPEKRSCSQFFVVWGHEVTEADLLKIETSKGFKYSDAQKEAYIREGGYPELDGDYSVFGELIEGKEVLETLKNTPGDFHKRPLEDVHTRIQASRKTLTAALMNQVLEK